MTYSGNFQDANLYNGIFIHSHFMKTDFQNASFADANLQGAKLSDVNLSGANFHGADLRGADLSGTDLEGVLWGWTKYSPNTQWPDGFKPENAGVLLEEDGEFNSRNIPGIPPRPIYKP